MFPDRWKSLEDVPLLEPSRVGVVLHAYYTEQLPGLFDRLRRIPTGYDLWITNASGEPIEVPAELGRARGVRVLEVENRGRDILPLCSLVNAGYLDPYDLLLKVHTKRSDWRAAHDTLEGDGAAWRDELVDAVLGDEADLTAILAGFAEQSDLGLVTADGSLLGPEYWGGNEVNVADLLRRLELETDRSRLRFAAGSMYWVRGFAVQGLRALNLGPEDFEPEEGQVDGTTAHAVERILGVLVEEAGLRLLERSALERSSGDEYLRFDRAPVRPRARVVPFYLPQFHPIPENDRWWGTGFTEWTNVAAARPVYDGHHQPLLPRDLGFYDLRLDEVRSAQHALAEASGISGLMYYYYWFAGKRLLDAPVEALVRSDIPQPFCVMWANENWTRRWDGGDSDVLIAQDEGVSPEAFIEDILPLLADERYMTIHGRKIVAVYKPGQIAGFTDVVASWRSRARAAGAGELFVVAVDFGGERGLDDTRRHGVDASLGFPPHNHLWEKIPEGVAEVDRRFKGAVLSYAALVEDACRRLQSGESTPSFPGVMVAFDNTPRRQWSPHIWFGSNPYTFRRWLAAAVESVSERPPDERLVFVNAWNEWAEGAVLEPTERFGQTFLLAVREVVRG